MGDLVWCDKMFRRQMPLEVVNTSVTVSAQMTGKSVLAVTPPMSLPVGPVGEVLRRTTGIARPTMPTVRREHVSGEGALCTVHAGAARARELNCLWCLELDVELNRALELDIKSRSNCGKMEGNRRSEEKLYTLYQVNAAKALCLSVRMLLNALGVPDFAKG
ncbi:hypothetical protein CLCR_09133 [Cladophialophora carrionii]|uniref:Uncharacterized protein n=1 Tax=Cladophialophora carrionii TaxID=86049 RepID=A0A1C1CTS2_9EURO|nr:hypothetical protein CLCR_09133 [Cladophialophora carrionii]